MSACTQVSETSSAFAILPKVPSVLAVVSGANSPQVPEILANMVSRAYSAEAYGKSWAMDIMSTMASNTALFYAVMFGELMHTRVLRGIAQGSTMELEIGTRAIQHICHEIGDPNRAVLDSTIWAVVILGYSGRQAPLRLGSKYPRQSFLRELQSIHVYCKMEIVLEHVLGLIRLVNLVGGLQNIKTRGMAQVISLYVGLLHECSLCFGWTTKFPFLVIDTYADYSCKTAAELWALVAPFRSQYSPF
jgi:hypothetical protein